MNVFFLSLCSFYFLGWFSSGLAYFKQSKRSLKISQLLLYISFVTHLAFIIFYFFAGNKQFLFSLPFFFVFLSFISSLVLLFYYSFHGENSSIFVFSFLSLSLLLFSYLAERLPNSSDSFVSSYPLLKNALLFVHASSLTVGYILFAVASFFSIFFLYLERSIKEKKLDLFSKPAPSLARIERLIVNASGIGFILMTVGLIVGFAMGYFSQSSNSLIMRQAFPFITWWIYGVYLLMHTVSGFRGRNIAIWSIFGFLSAVSSYLFEIWSLIST